MSTGKKLQVLALLLFSLLVVRNASRFAAANRQFMEVLPLSVARGVSPPVAPHPEERLRHLQRGLVRAHDRIHVLTQRLDALVRTRARLENAPRLVPAAVIARVDPSHYHRSLLIDRGADDGLSAGDAVLWRGALVGRLSHVTSSRSRVRLVTDPGMRLKAVLFSPSLRFPEPSQLPARGPSASTARVVREVGFLVGTGRGCQVRFVQQSVPVRKGDWVLSSAYRGMVPWGLVVGRVTGVANRDYNLYWEIDVSPEVEPERLEEVLVLPARRDGEEAMRMRSASVGRSR